MGDLGGLTSQLTTSSFGRDQWRSQAPAFGGPECKRSEKKWGSGGLPSSKFLKATPFRRSENEGNALFSYILHHKHDYIEHKMQDVLLNFDQEFILIIASYSKKAKEEFLFSYKRSNISSTKYEMDLLSFTAK